MTDEVNNRTAIIASLVVFAFSIILFTIGATAEAGAMRGSGGVILLFLLPLLLQLGGLVYLYLRPLKSERSAGFFKLYWGTLFLCATLNYGFWLWYYLIVHETDPRIPNKWASYLCLFFIALLLLVISLVTLAFMTPLDGDGIDDSSFRRLLDNIKTGASRRPFWTLLHSMSVFLTVSFLFGFAFAFHDLSVPLPKENAQPQAAGALPQPVASPSTNESSQPLSTKEPSQMPPLYMANLPNFEKDQPAPSGDESGPCIDFKFAEPSARLDRFGAGEKVDPEMLRQEYNLKFADEDKAARSKANQDTMKWAVDRIATLTVNGKQAYVQLLGHASRKPVKSGPYSNNYDLSEARVLTVLTELKSEVRRKKGGQYANVEWELIPLSSDEFPQARTDMEKFCGPGGRDDKVVKVYITSVADHPFYHWWKRFKSDDFNRLTLLDHIYFSMYTITTTGYGDIVPTTNYAKSLTCLANICEVFFFVGFFNSLMALKGRDQEAEITYPTGEAKITHPTGKTVNINPPGQG
jgi:hypothetical protein